LGGQPQIPDFGANFKSSALHTPPAGSLRNPPIKGTPKIQEIFGADQSHTL
jgi:hypothetical protein